MHCTLRARMHATRVDTCITYYIITCMHACTDGCMRCEYDMHTHMQTTMNKQKRTDRHTHTNINIYTCIDACTGACIANIHAHIHCLRTRTACKHTTTTRAHTHTRMLMHIHAHTHVYMQMLHTQPALHTDA